MAIIGKFEKKQGPRSPKEQTEVNCSYFVFDGCDGKKYIQLETYGSSSREIPGKTSQVLRLDENTARQLIGIIQAELLA